MAANIGNNCNNANKNNFFVCKMFYEKVKYDASWLLLWIFLQIVRKTKRLFILLQHFCECTRSSMDRIPDSGSDDMSSILIGCTNDKILEGELLIKPIVFCCRLFLSIIKKYHLLCKEYVFIWECAFFSVFLPS